MSDTPRIRDLLRLVRWRAEPFAIVLLSFSVIFFANVMVHGDPARQSPDALLYTAGWNFLLSVFFALLFELSYAGIRVTGALFQRTGRLWTYSVPALSVFFLIVEPLFDSGGILQAILSDRTMLSSLYLTLLMFLSVGIFLLLVVLPVFHGLNAAFLLASILLSRLLLLPLQNLFFPHVSDFSAGKFLLFVFLAFSLAALLYIYLQTRRRTGLSPHYERFALNRYWFLSLVPLILFSGIGLYLLGGHVRLFHPLLDIFYLNLVASVAFALLLLFLLLRKESKSAVASRLPGSKTFLFFVMIVISTVTGLVRSYQPDYVFFARETAAGRFLELISVMADRDMDGNSFWPGQDPDDVNPGVRREGKGEFRNGLGDLDSAGYPGVDRILMTFVIPGLVAENPVYSLHPEPVAGAEPGLQSEPPEGLHYWMQPSNQPERSLRALFQGLSSLEEVHGVERRSLVSYAAEDGYRTLCFGIDDGSNYFSHDHPARLDSGCQVFETLPEPVADDYSSCVVGVLQAAEKLIGQYRENHTFLWLHIDTRRCAGKAEPDRITAQQQRDAILKIIAGLQATDTGMPFLSATSRRLLAVVMETGYLPYFYVSARDEFWRARKGASLYSQILSGHLFFLRWYFADMLEREFKPEPQPASALREAEQHFQKGGAADLNGWIFLEENPDQSIRWFRSVIGLQGVERRLPPMMLYYDARRRRLTYSHGMWNRMVEFKNQEQTPSEEEEPERP